MYILGINAFHAAASACLIQDGRLIAAASEERFNRRKYYAGFPTLAIKYVLAEAGISAYDLEHVGISRDPSANLLKKVLFTLSKRSNLALIKKRLSNAAEVRNPKTQLAAALSLEAAALRAQFHNVEHHRAHLASAFYVSPFQEAAVLSIDGVGDFVSTMWGVGHGSDIQVMGAINFPHSLGFFYTAISQWLGFSKYGDEGKVMGLAPYGRPVHLDKMRRIVRIQCDGTFELNLDYFVIHTQGVAMSWEEGDPVLGNLFSSELIRLLGEPRVPGAEITTYHEDIACSLQVMLEEAEFALLRKLQRETNQRSVCLAGGVAMNSVFNGKVLPNTDFDDIYIQPAAGDDGTALGVCFYIWNQVLGRARCYSMDNAYTGPSFSSAVIQDALQCHQMNYITLNDDTLVQRVAKIVAEGNIVGWFQGRMEWGARALGNRSIIADPRRHDMKSILNARIKNREPFRPFAPSILSERVGEYFDQSYPDPFMLKVYNVLPDKRATIPAVTHIDGTGRLQTVDRETAPLYWRLIKAFDELTGVPVILNTSFNENEPIVCTPCEAIQCFLRTNMDTLVIGNHIVAK